MELTNEEINAKEFEVPPLEEVSEVLERININTQIIKGTSSSDTNKIAKPKLSCPNESKLNKPKLGSSSKFGGLKKGFLFGRKETQKTVVTVPVCKSKQDEENTGRGELPFIKAKPANSGLTLQEVQETMRKENPLGNIQDDFTSRIASHPKVTQVLSDSTWLPILDEFQTDAGKAMLKYKDNEEVKSTMKELCSILGDSFLHMTSAPRSDEEVMCGRLMEDPRLREALLDPFVESVMAWMKEGRKDRVQQCLRTATPPQKAKIQMLIDYGLFSYVS